MSTMGKTLRLNRQFPWPVRKGMNTSACVSSAVTGVSMLLFSPCANKKKNDIAPDTERDAVKSVHTAHLVIFRESLSIVDLPQNVSPWWKNKMTGDAQSPFN